MDEYILTVDERVRLIGIIAGLYEFESGPPANTQFIRTAGLSRFLGTLVLAAAPKTAAGALVNQLERFGELPDRPGYHALGALLSYMLTIGELSNPNKAFLAELVVKYNLVDDSSYIARLRVDYELDTRSARPPSVLRFAAPTPDWTTKEPSIEVEASPAGMSDLESIINSEDNFLDIYLLYGAIYCAQAVCRIEILGEPKGTGCLVGTDLVLTNQHVLKAKDYLESATVRFDFALDASGVTTQGRTFKVMPDFYESSPAEQFDFALVRLEERPIASASGNRDITGLNMMEMVLAGVHRGYLAVSPRFIREYERVNIIQHPQGNPQKVVLTQNYVVSDMSDTRVHYVADTMDGSSGSPVFNRNWEVVALHHSGKPYPPETIGETAKKAWKGKFRFNEGIPVRAFYNSLLKYLPR